MREVEIFYVAFVAMVVGAVALCALCSAGLEVGLRILYALLVGGMR